MGENRTCTNYLTCLPAGRFLIPNYLYSKFQLAGKYIKYYISASNGKGHGIHSPFLFKFIKFVLNDRRHYEVYDSAEAIRDQLLKNQEIIEVEDFGAGSTVFRTKKRKISDIAATSLKPKKYSQLLFRIAQYYETQNVLELGTSLGVTTSYLAFAANNPSVTTMEGSVNIAAVSQQNFAQLRLKNINIITGDFEKTLEPFLQSSEKIDFAFLDGNHRKIPTLKYFQQILAASHEHSILVFDDIHWSKEMEETWAEIKADDAITMSIDLFFIGIVFLRKDFKAKQHFTIRF